MTVKSISVVKAVAAPAAAAWSPGGWAGLTEPLAFINEGNFACCCRAKVILK